MKNPNKFKIDAKLIGHKTGIELNGKPLNHIREYQLNGRYDEVTRLQIEFLLDDSIIEGEAECDYKFDIDLPNNVRKVLYEQLKTEFEE